MVDDLPVNVLDLAEFDLGLDLVPAYALTEECDTDAVLLGDLKTILRLCNLVKASNELRRSH